MATLWFAPKAKVTIGDYDGITSGESIITYMASLGEEAVYTGIVKDVKISGGERDVEALKLLGYNELLDEKRATIVECTFTTAYQGSVNYVDASYTRSTQLDPFEMIAGIKQTTAGNYKRSTIGEKSTNDRTRKAVNIQLSDGTYTVDLLLDDAACTSIDFNLAADGHAEQTMTFKTLASKYYEEDNYTD